MIFGTGAGKTVSRTRMSVDSLVTLYRQHLSLSFNLLSHMQYTFFYKGLCTVKDSLNPFCGALIQHLEEMTPTPNRPM